MITCRIRSNEPELNNQEVTVHDYQADGRCLVSLRDCPRLAFWWDRSALQLEEVHKCSCGLRNSEITQYVELLGKWMCETCREELANQIYPS
jgi:hypothetical protein